jgi:CDP-glucose 4,6-dehydratase
MFDAEFFRDKKVLVTGHTGFVGSWMCHVLVGLGAQVSGYALQPSTNPNLFTICGLEDKMDSTIGDIRDYEMLNNKVLDAGGEIIFHLAAQPIVRESYLNPRETYETNVMGTVNLLECIRIAKRPPLSVVNVTTDKVYQNNENQVGFAESDPLDGFDPYSNSKSCSELVTHSYKNSFFDPMGIPISTARAGNIIGGGDFAKDRILPDCIRAAQNREPIIVRNPHSIRPYQHVLETVFAYLLIAQKQYSHLKYADYYNIGPDENDCQNTAEIATLFCKHWGDGQVWETKPMATLSHEASYLKLNCTKIKDTFGWRPHWKVDTAIAKTVEWSKVYAAGGDVVGTMNQQIAEFLKQ